MARTDKVAKLLIVDGQQRLTSLFAVLTGNPVLTKTFEEKRIRIAFRPTDETFEVTDAAIEQDPEFIPDITALWDDGYKSTVREFLDRLGENRSGRARPRGAGRRSRGAHRSGSMTCGTSASRSSN